MKINIGKILEDSKKIIMDKICIYNIRTNKNIFEQLSEELNSSCKYNSKWIQHHFNFHESLGIYVILSGCGAPSPILINTEIGSTGIPCPDCRSIIDKYASLCKQFQ